MFPAAHCVYRLILFIIVWALCVDARPIDSISSSSSSSQRQTQFEQLTEVELGKKTYDLIPKLYQGKVADYYEIVGYGSPAILKVMENTGDTLTRKRMIKEAEYSDRVGLLLTNRVDKKFFYFALRDVRSRFPYSNSPPLKLAHEWYMEDKTINANEMIATLSKNIEQTLVEYIKDTELLYSHVTFDSMYTDREFEYIMPVNWGPPTEGSRRGVQELKADGAGAGAYYNDLEKIIGEQINIDMLGRVLDRHGKRLRLKDGGSWLRVKLDRTEEYKLEALTAQGMFSQAYTLVGGYEDQGTKKTVPAILKIINAAGESKDIAETEIGYLKTVGLYLYAKLEHDDDDLYYLIVMRDIRTGFPKKSSPSLKPFYEWYQEDKKMDVEKSLKKFRNAIEKRLIKFAEKDGLLYNDYHFRNIFVDRKLKVVMPIDWSPPVYASGKIFSGVEEITTKDKKERKKMIRQYQDKLRTKLPEYFNAELLEREILKSQ